jgi:DNA-binding NarL/FixJ family response regulator
MSTDRIDVTLPERRGVGHRKVGINPNIGKPRTTIIPEEYTVILEGQGRLRVLNVPAGTPYREMIALAGVHGEAWPNDEQLQAPLSYNPIYELVRTTRRRQVLALVASGLSNRAISRHLLIDEDTARNHITYLLRKLQAETRTEIARLFYLGQKDPEGFIARYLPSSLSSLSREPISPPKRPSSLGLSADVEQSWRDYTSGISITESATRRQMPPTTVSSHIKKIRELLGVSTNDEVRAHYSRYDHSLRPVLSNQQRELLQLVEAGMTFPRIAERLKLSPNSIEGRRKRAYALLNAHNREEALSRFRELYPQQNQPQI